ncbi:unnamed protein product [Prorocentrum cordatum]|nr:unnamed protein product [Polarella glacialis]
MGPTLIQTFGMTNLQFGMLTTTFAFAKLCWNIPSSILAERYGRKPLLVGGLCCIATGLGGVAAASCYEELLLLRLLVGTGVASTFTAAGMYITDISHPLNSARTRAPMQMGMSAGLLLGPAGGGYLLEHWGLQTTSVVVGLISLGTVLLASLVLPETLVHSGARRRTGGLMQTLQSWGPILQDKSFRRILSWGFCYNGAFFAAHALLPLAFTDLSLSPSVIGGVSTANAVVGLIATPIVARAADHFGKLAVVLPGAVLYGSCLILVPQATSLLELLPILATMQVGGAMCSQGQMHAMDQVGIRHRAKVPGLWNTFGDVGMLTTSAACATIAQLSGTTTAFQADGMFLLVATSVLFWVSRLR